MYKATVNDDSLKNGLAVSAGLHFLMFLFLYFGLPHLIPPLPEHHEPVPFSIVTIADMTNTRIRKHDEPKHKPAPPPKPKAPPAPAKPPEPKPVEQAKLQPPAPPLPAKLEKDIEALKSLPAKKLKPKPVEKPKPQPDLMASVLKNIAKLKPAPQTKPTDQKTDAKAAEQPAQTMAPALSDRLTISEEDALRRQIGQCWSPPIGARDAQNLVVEITIDVNPDRTVADADIVDKARYNSDPFFRAAADAAVRAVRNPKCNPLILPPGKYDQWKRIDFTFDPRDFL
ncbi:MAG: energy transducer TonB [Alphaproteobacteria bacterium]|nr:energy transducer TonB [Alphaproteobacteria bacterium]